MDVLAAVLVAAIVVAFYLGVLVLDDIENRAAAAFDEETQRQLSRPRIRIVWSRDGGR